EAGMGLQFHHIPDGVFESGGKGTNTVEAKAVAKAIMEHARKYPEQSLGVATFSVSQRKAIQDELELLRRLNPDLEEFFNAHPSEPFFVKNLENVQGDERDVIMISVGYARNTQGYMAMRFGPLGSEGGERRLNVLISRAKRRCEVFASITDEDIDLERAKGKGVFAFKLFLQYARTGRISLAQRTEREMDSVFEEQVADALQKAGYQVHPQVGIAGFFIDLAIADPDMPGRYLIGIECDGRAYHSSRSARERDRLRQAVLEDHGWIIHRIWSTDWFHRPEEQLERTLQAIESAKKELSERTEQLKQRTRAVPVEIVTVDRGPVVEIGLVDSDIAKESEIAYVEATPSANMGYELHETPLGILSEIIEQIVEVESP
ncbi:helicase, partial [Citrobacter braakii]|nr:helicase [Citrobacter braakii]